MEKLRIISWFKRPGFPPAGAAPVEPQDKTFKRNQVVKRLRSSRQTSYRLYKFSVAPEIPF
jgi:hypothetical protein